MSDSKNCPFCGGEPKIYIGPDHLWRVFCSNVWLCGAKTVGFEQKCDAINKWNTRADSSELNHIRQQNSELVNCLSDVIKETEMSYAVRTHPYDKAKQLLSKIKGEKDGNTINSKTILSSGEFL
ncbi:TPA: Lar family restriction alleviation protein [Vibrio cholerae]